MNEPGVTARAMMGALWHKLQFVSISSAAL